MPAIGATRARGAPWLTHRCSACSPALDVGSASGRRLATELSSPRLAVSNGMEACITEMVRPHRRLLAEKELADVLPTIANLRFELEDGSLDLLHQGRLQDTEAVGAPAGAAAAAGGNADASSRAC